MLLFDIIFIFIIYLYYKMQDVRNTYNDYVDWIYTYVKSFFYETPDMVAENEEQVDEYEENKLNQGNTQK